MGTYRYLLRGPDVRLDPDLGYLTPEGIVGYYSPDDPHDPSAPDATPRGTHIRSEDGDEYEIVGRAVRDIPDLTIGVLFVRVVSELPGS